MQKAEANDDHDGPHDEQQDQRQRAIEAQEGLAASRVLDAARHGAVRTPRDDVEGDRDAKASGDAAWEDYGFEGVPQAAGDEPEAKHEDHHRGEHFRYRAQGFLKNRYAGGPYSHQPVHRRASSEAKAARGALAFDFDFDFHLDEAGVP